MANVPISGMSAASSIAGTDELELHQGAAGSGSVKATVTQIRQSAGTLPVVISTGAEFTSTAAPTATLPGTHALNDILLLILQSSNQTIATPTGYTQLGPQNGIGAAASAGSTRLGIFWKRDNGSESAPTIADSGDHTYGVMLAIRGCPTVGDPFRMLGQSWKFTASTTGTADTGTTRGDNSLILNIFAHALDQAGAAASAPSNSSLTSLTEVFDDSTTDGTGGGILIMSGVKATAGEVTGTTVVWSSSTVDVSTTIAFVPKDAFPMPRGPETMTYIGSTADLDDTWAKPYGARKVFVQLVDGGGSGSGGNTTTTAAGGGGGGGGGYDEAWYEAEDLQPTLIVHPGKGGAIGTALNQAGNVGVISEFDKGSAAGPLTSQSRVAGIAATAAASADGGNGGGGSGRGTTAIGVNTTRTTMEALSAANAIAANGGIGGRGGSGTTAPVGGSPADWGGGGGESGADTDTAITAVNNGYSLRGAGGGAGGRTNTNASIGGYGGGIGSPAGQGTNGNDSTRLPFGGSGGNGGGTTKVTGGNGGFPGGGGGGGAGVAGGFGGAGGHGVVMVTTFF